MRNGIGITALWGHTLASTETATLALNVQDATNVGAAEFGKRYVTRIPQSHPRYMSTDATPCTSFSTGIWRTDDAGKGVGQAIMRVDGLSIDHEQVDALTRRLLDWINTPGRSETCPAEVEIPGADASARIRVTKAGRQLGFVPIPRRQGRLYRPRRTVPASCGAVSRG